MHSDTKMKFLDSLEPLEFLAKRARLLWESGVGSDVMKPIAAPIVGGMITSTIHVLIPVPVFFALMKERALRRGTLHLQGNDPAKD